MSNETMPEGQSKGFEQTLQLLEAFREMTAVMMELIRKPAANNTYNYQVYHAPVYNYNGLHQEADDNSQETDGEPPSAEEMVVACEQTRSECLWWGNASWSVTFRVYCILGYKGNETSFIEDVNSWPFKKPFAYICNRHSLGRPLQRGRINGPLEKWASDGASTQEIKLGERLMEILVGMKK